MEDDFELEYVKESTVTEILVKEVAEEYISQLRIDLNNIKKDPDFKKFVEISENLD